MSTVYYSLLAGKYYYGLDNIYRANESFVKNVMHTFAVPAAHPTFISKDLAIGPPDVRRKEVIHSVNDFGNPITITEIKSVYREPFHSFRYYESLGSIYGMHCIIMDYNGKNDDGNVRQQWESEPISIERIDRMNIVGEKSNYNSTEKMCALSIMATANQNGITLEYDKSYTKDGEDFIEAFVGEYHLLPNNPSSIYRCNIAWDIHPHVGTYASMIDSKINHRVIFDGDKKSSIYTDSNSSNVTYSNAAAKDEAVQKKEINISNSHFVEYYLGTSKVSKLSTRPKDMQDSTLSMRHPNYMEAGSQIRWKSMRDKCTTWNRIYDGTNVADIINPNIVKSGHYVMNTKLLININKLKEYISELHSGISTEVKYKIILYLPYFSVLAHDSVEEIKYPKLASFIDMFDQLDFKIPINYKTGGSYHFILSFYDKDKETLLFRDSSLSTIGLYVNTAKTKMSIRKGKWYFINNSNKEFIEEIPDKPIRFNCDFETGHGINHEMYYNIRYSPSNDLISYITMNSGIYLKITTYDGTLREESGYTTLIRK